MLNPQAVPHGAQVPRTRELVCDLKSLCSTSLMNVMSLSTQMRGADTDEPSKIWPLTTTSLDMYYIKAKDNGPNAAQPLYVNLPRCFKLAGTRATFIDSQRTSASCGAVPQDYQSRYRHSLAVIKNR
jgi:hypothetical protein